MLLVMECTNYCTLTVARSYVQHNPLSHVIISVMSLCHYTTATVTRYVYYCILFGSHIHCVSKNKPKYYLQLQQTLIKVHQNWQIPMLIKVINNGHPHLSIFSINLENWLPLITDIGQHNSWYEIQQFVILLNKSSYSYQNFCSKCPPCALMWASTLLIIVYQTSPALDELKQQLQEEWAWLSQKTVSDAINQWLCKLQVCTRSMRWSFRTETLTAIRVTVTQWPFCSTSVIRGSQLSKVMHLLELWWNIFWLTFLRHGDMPVYITYSLRPVHIF